MWTACLISAHPKAFYFDLNASISFSFQVEFVNEEQCDRRLTSYINLIDLAGSECCTKAQTTGERLKVNKEWKSMERVWLLRTPLNSKACSPNRIFGQNCTYKRMYMALMLISIASHFASEREWRAWRSCFDYAMWQILLRTPLLMLCRCNDPAEGVRGDCDFGNHESNIKWSWGLPLFAAPN